MIDMDYFIMEVENSKNLPFVLADESLADEIFGEVKVIYPEAVLVKVAANGNQYIAINQKSRRKLRQMLNDKRLYFKKRAAELATKSVRMEQAAEELAEKLSEIGE